MTCLCKFLSRSFILFAVLVFTFFDNLLGNFIENLIGKSLPGIGIIISIFVILITGFIVTNVLGAKVFDFGERLLKKIPIVPKIYFGTKQIIDAFSLQGKQVFNRVALVEYPRKGSYAVGFVTGECKGEVQDKTREKLINVFIPTTPNPTSGMLILVPDDEIVYLDMSIEDGLKLIVSAGVVVPDKTKNSEDFIA